MAFIVPRLFHIITLTKHVILFHDIWLKVLIYLEKKNIILFNRTDLVLFVGISSICTVIYSKIFWKNVIAILIPDHGKKSLKLFEEHIFHTKIFNFMFCSVPEKLYANQVINGQITGVTFSIFCRFTL